MNENKKNPLDLFFKLGEKATKGDPVRKADFDYCMMWILFIGFMTIFARNIFYFVNTWQFNFLAWGLIGGAISYFQYFALVSFYQRRKSIRKVYEGKQEYKELKEDSVKEMLSEF